MCIRDSCEAMANLLAERQNTFFHDYRVIVAAGSAAGMGVELSLIHIFMLACFSTMKANPL